MRAVEDVADETILRLSSGTLARVNVSVSSLPTVIHAWGPRRFHRRQRTAGPELVEFTYGYLRTRADGWRVHGVFGARVEVPRGAERQTELLAITGRKA